MRRLDRGAASSRLGALEHRLLALVPSAWVDLVSIITAGAGPRAIRARALDLIALPTSSPSAMVATERCRRDVAQRIEHLRERDQPGVGEAERVQRDREAV